MAEIAFEYLLSKIETTKGTAESAPDRWHLLGGALMPKNEYYMPEDRDGTLAMNRRATVVREWAEGEVEGQLNINEIHRFFLCSLNGSVTPTTVAAGVYSWVFVRNMASDTLKSMTLWGGDPNTQIFRAAMAMIEEMTITADGTGTDGTMFKANFQAKKETKVSAPTAPAVPVPLSLMPGQMQVFLEPNSSNAYGTTDVTSRVLSVEHVLPSGVTYKFGPGSTTIKRTGLKKVQPETTVEMEFLDATDYDNVRAGLPVRIRVKHLTANLIDATNYGFVQVDMYGPLTDVDWGDYEDSNRTIKFTIPALYDTTIATDVRVTVQNATNTN